MKRRRILLVDESFEFLEQVSADLGDVTDTIVATDSIEALQQLCHSPDFDVLAVGRRVRPVSDVTLAQVFHEMHPGGTVYFLVDDDDPTQDAQRRMSIPGARFIMRADIAPYVAGALAPMCERRHD